MPNLTYEDIIKECVDSLLEDEDPNSNKLLSREAHRQKLELDVRKELDCTEFANEMSNAVKILRNEGTSYLSVESYNALVANLDNLYETLENLDIHSLQLLPENADSILQIAIAKFKEEHSSESLSLLAFLATIEPKNPDFWYRFGLLAEQMKRYDLAIQAFSNAIKLEPQFLGARVFKANCHLQKGEKDEAIKEIEIVKNMIHSAGDTENWSEYITSIEALTSK